MLKKFPPPQPILEKKTWNTLNILAPFSSLSICSVVLASQTVKCHLNIIQEKWGVSRNFFVWIVAIRQLKPTYKDVEFSRSAWTGSYIIGKLFTIQVD